MFPFNLQLATAIALVGGFKSVFKSAFGIVLSIHFQIIKTFKDLPCTNLPNSDDKKQLLSIRRNSIVLLNLLLLYYIALVLIATKRDPEIKQEIDNALSVNSQEQIVFVIL